MKNYTVTQIKAACRALEAISTAEVAGTLTKGAFDAAALDARAIIRDGLAEIVAAHKKANEAAPFVPTVTEKGRGR